MSTSRLGWAFGAPGRRLLGAGARAVLLDLASQPGLLGAATITVYWQHDVPEARIVPLVT